MSSQTSKPTQDGPSRIEQALRKNTQATDAVQDVADELAVVHAVLDSDIPKKTLTPEVDRAIERTEQLERQLGTSAANLQKVNETLREELSRRSVV
ncbi:hypothetical protein [uncultured Variovorax sp.]|uniref:hypothetical protein n=1 Tax=uncultured Variovorax sp. TaxID=114708 RepID=UPI0025F2989E|nr:hypothetical protein [uncultured Variovorax sp.]